MLDANNVSPDKLRDLELTTLLHVVEAFSRNILSVLLDCGDPSLGVLN
jgi:hypothetical protein